MKNAVFWDVVQCRSCVNWRFGGRYRLHLRSRKIRERGTSHLLTLVPRSRIFLLRRWRRYVPQKRRFTQDLNGAISQNKALFICPLRSPTLIRTTSHSISFLYLFLSFISYIFHYYLIYTLLTVNNFWLIYIRGLFFLQISMLAFRTHQNTPHQSVTSPTSDTHALSL
jgi:hypothetical protein